MAGHHTVGPIGMSGVASRLDEGTLSLQRSPQSGPVGITPEQPPAPVEERSATVKGGWRPLTAGEIQMSKVIFKDSIDYTKVKVHNREYLWFGLQPDDTAMTPNGELYFNPSRFKEDFAIADYLDRLWFMHEMVHVWQWQLGYPVKFRGAIRIGLSYGYTLKEGQKLSDFNMEAQGNVLSDYWALAVYGNPPSLWEGKHINDMKLYEKVLADFIANPSDRANLPGGQ